MKRWELSFTDEKKEQSSLQQDFTYKFLSCIVWNPLFVVDRMGSKVFISLASLELSK